MESSDVHNEGWQAGQIAVRPHYVDDVTQNYTVSQECQQYYELFP